MRLKEIVNADLKVYFYQQQKPSLPYIKCKTAFAYCFMQYQTEFDMFRNQDHRLYEGFHWSLL